MSDDARTPARSRTEKTEIVLPQHANAIGTAFGGTVMAWVDICAAVSSQRHCGRVAVTASVDGLDFLAPLRVGDVVTLTAQVNAVFRTSMEVGVTVEKENTLTGERVLCAESLLTFVNIGDDGRPCAIPPLQLVTDQDHARDTAARARRAHRLAQRA